MKGLLPPLIPDMEIKSTLPVLRIFDETKAREYYVGYLGFEAKWEHRFAEGFPLYMGVAQGGCALHLTEHHGDACPGSTVRVEVVGLDDFHRALLAKEYKYSCPGIEDTSWGLRELRLGDPFGNRLIFWEPMSRS